MVAPVERDRLEKVRITSLPLRPLPLTLVCLSPGALGPVSDGLGLEGIMNTGPENQA